MKIDKYFDRKWKRNCWRFDVTIGGQRIRRGGFAKKVDAENAVAALRLLVQRQQYGLPTGLPGVTLGALLRKLDADPRHAANRVLAFRKFTEFLGEQLLIAQLTRAHILRFAEHLTASGLQAATVKYYLSLVRAYLRGADRYYPSLEGYQPPRFPPMPRGNVRQRVLTQAELGAILRAMLTPLPGERVLAPMRDKLFDLARLMLLTGARREELMKITPDRINFEWKTLNLKSSKVKREHVIALGDLALEILRQRIEKTPAGEGLFDGLTMLRVARVLTHAAEVSGVAYGQNVPGGWSLHDFRRTAATIIEDAGLPYSAVSAQLGHHRPDMTARYTVPQLDTLRRAAQILENWCRDIDGIFGATGALQGQLESEAMLRK